MVQQVARTRKWRLSEDEAFVIKAARTILGDSNVATTTAGCLLRLGIDSQRLAQFVEKNDELGDFRFKLILADPEEPENFGILVRRVKPD